jgi:hypothetical protein
MTDQFAEKVAACGGDGAFDEGTEEVVRLAARLKPLGIVE